MNTPELHPNFFLACLQLIFLVFFKPLTLRGYIKNLNENENLINDSPKEFKRFFAIAFVSSTAIPFLLFLISLIQGNKALITWSCYNICFGGMAIIVGVFVAKQKFEISKNFMNKYGYLLFIALGAIGFFIYRIIRFVIIGATGSEMTGILYGIIKGISFGTGIGFLTGILSGIPGVVTVGIISGIALAILLIPILIFSPILFEEYGHYMTVQITRGFGFGLIFGAVENLFQLGLSFIAIAFMYFLMGMEGLDFSVYAIAFGVSGFTTIFIIYYRVHHYAFEFILHYIVLFLSRLKPEYTLRAIKISPPFWDEIIRFPLPFLDNLLRETFKHNKEEGLKRIEHVSQSPWQNKAAFSALAWITSDTLKDVSDTSSLISTVNQVYWLPENLENLGKDTAEILPNLLSVGRGVESVWKSDLYSCRLSLRDALEQLDTLANRTKYLGRLAVERWEPVIEQWHKVISEELMSLSNSASGTENPFQTGNPIQLTRKTLFRGRQDLRDAVVNSLLERNRPTLVLHGPRRMGKTSFLLQLPALLPGNTIPVFTDLQRPACTKDTATFLYHIARAMSRDARPYRIIVPPPERQLFSDSPFEAFGDWLEEVGLPAFRDFNVLLAFDEFEKLGEAIEKGRIDHDILDELRHLIQHQTQLAFLFAGVRTMEDLGPDWPSYFINIKPIQIGYLLPDEARSLITDPDPDANFNLTFDEEAVQRIIDSTRCHPYLVQLVCSAIVEEANAAKTLQVDLPLLEKAFVRALNQGEPYFRNVWDEMADTDGQATLKRIAQAGGPVALDDTDSRAAIARMVKLKVLTKHDDGTYEVEVPLVRRWVSEFSPA